jgi:hypothetical protein
VYDDLIAITDVVGTDRPAGAPEVTRLHPASPNPLHVGTRPRFELAESGAVRWDARDWRERDVSSGVYFVRLETSLGVERRGTVRVVR